MDTHNHHHSVYTVHIHTQTHRNTQVYPLTYIIQIARVSPSFLCAMRRTRYADTILGLINMYAAAAATGCIDYFGVVSRIVPIYVYTR